ncbi:unnamed protein product [Pelagomonas calceolata]|uniref:Uncharacterized protein n=1 Tax=Pelagomonas calceolata TaxID=35677 RepID=A0A8J2X1I7_9STRA|nr:unnamed protein product [Pelagomonas calceolata]
MGLTLNPGSGTRRDMLAACASKASRRRGFQLEAPNSCGSKAAPARPRINLPKYHGVCGGRLPGRSGPPSDGLVLGAPLRLRGR